MRKAFAENIAMDLWWFVEAHFMSLDLQGAVAQVRAAGLAHSDNCTTQNASISGISLMPEG